MPINVLRLDQARQNADILQAYVVLREARDRLLRHRGTMRWKAIKGRDYLYRRTGAQDRSLGPRSAQTEAVKAAFDKAKSEANELHDAARRRIEEMAPVARALGLGRVPLIASRIARRLDDERLLGATVSIVGTNSLYCYEAMAGGHFPLALASTEDIDLLFDSRTRLQIVSEELPAAGLLGLLRSVDASFRKLTNGFRVVNRDNYLVDLIAPMPKDVLRSAPQTLLGVGDDLVAAEIFGLQWLVNAPKVSAVAIDARGLPVPLVCVDPRVYALHKLWLSEREDRTPAKRQRDRAQAEAVADLVAQHLPALRFDDRGLDMLPKALRLRASELMCDDREPDPAW